MIVHCARLGRGVAGAGALALCSLIFGIGGAGVSPAYADPMPGLPSIPLTAAPLANGVQNGITYEYGTEFVTIGAPGNAAYTGAGLNRNRGRVDYEYRMGRYEITSAQWVNFFNAAALQPSGQAIPYLTIPTFWGGEIDPTYQGSGLRFRVTPGREMMPVGNISWRAAAVYCNWLHNDQSTERSAFLNGAYDVSTFGYAGPTGALFTDQRTHNPGARFWIPTQDEWIKAAHYDPNRHGEGQGGWWNYNNATDTPLHGGPPGGTGFNQFGQIGPASGNFGWESAGLNEFRVLLGSYPTVQTPWGLLDTAGGTTEWTEGVGGDIDSLARLQGGSAWGSSASDGWANSIFALRGDFPSYPIFDYGFRIAAAIPSPTGGLVLAGWLLLSGHRKRRE